MQKAFYNMTQNDTLAIEEFEELKFLSTKPTKKRFCAFKMLPPVTD